MIKYFCETTFLSATLSFATDTYHERPEEAQRNISFTRIGSSVMGA
jgi:hypothetical protein